MIFLLDKGLLCDYYFVFGFVIRPLVSVYYDHGIERRKSSRLR